MEVSVSVYLEEEEEEEEEEEVGRCALIWLGRNSTPILVSNFVDRYKLLARTSCDECDYADFPAHLVSSRNSPPSSLRAYSLLT